jgi:dienelactone hydrolase
VATDGAAGVRRLALTVRGRQGHVPTVAWLPAAATRPPVVLLAHGGSGHKESDRQERLAQGLAASGIAGLAIDGPFHGDRRSAGEGPLDYQRRVVDEGATQVHTRMGDDWLAALYVAGATGLVDHGRVGFIGMSMGARYGLPVCAALGARLQAAVLGKFGLTSIPELALLAADESIREAAQQITAPVLWHLQGDDEVFRRDGQLELFDLLASIHKMQRARPGGHAVTRPDDENAWRAYVSGYLVSPLPK